MSKRSRSVALTLMAAVPMMLTACSPDPIPPHHSSQVTPKPKEKAYPTVDACVQAGNNPAECQTSFDQAMTEREANAPKFANKAECEQQFEYCGSSQSSSGIFMPLLGGYMLGSMMSNNRASYGSGLYKDRSGNINRLLKGKNAGSMVSVARRTSTRSITTAQASSDRRSYVNTKPQRAITVSRGGFGSRSSTRSFGG